MDNVFNIKKKKNIFIKVLVSICNPFSSKNYGFDRDEWVRSSSRNTYEENSLVSDLYRLVLLALESPFRFSKHRSNTIAVVEEILVLRNFKYRFWYYNNHFNIVINCIKFLIFNYSIIEEIIEKLIYHCLSSFKRKSN